MEASAQPLITMLSKSFTVVLAALAVTACAAANPEITAAARAEELQERQVSSILSGITANPGSILSQASSALASVTGGSSSNSAQASATGGSASATGTSPSGIIASITGAAGGAASSAAGNGAVASLQVSAPLVFGAATLVLSTLFGAAIVL
ncbi:hypothetical protein D9619_003924 [Psilocybe cf. subviscida]|uniref:Uncharacterized protein n=1 Tax=Psilocybe cf. subviscida TaxID=2480587 RepID=A0A8H5BQW6_9AGAR|nr:hypothetical protein D9619_003924 [Psilocybe cf. subviscida]